MVEERFISDTDGLDVRVLVCAPSSPVRKGSLLWFHGGGMIMGTPDVNEPWCRYLAHATECVVVAVGYRLAPEYPHPAGLDDGYAALRWLHSVHEELGFPRGKIAVAGESGGGCIAAGLAILARDRAEVSILAQFLQYPMLDDRTGTGSEPDPLPHTGEFVWTRESNLFAWSSVLAQGPGGANVSVYAAPGRLENGAGIAPVTIFIGDLDLFVGESLRYARALMRAGVKTEIHVYPGVYHGFISFAQEADVSKRARAEFVDAVNRHFDDRLP